MALRVHLKDLASGQGNGVVVVKDNDVYRVSDWRVLKNLVASITVLHPNQQTGGHAHLGDEEEIYVFLDGQGKMQIGEGESAETIEVGKEDIIAIPSGVFHKVFNPNLTTLVFFCVFQKPEKLVGARQETAK